MKYETVKSIILTVLVFLSASLTFALWTYQPRLSSLNDTYIDISIAEQKEISDIIRPYKIVYHDEDVSRGTVEQRDIDLHLEEFKNWSFFDVNEVYPRMDKTNFYDLIHGAGMVEIEFPNLVPLTTYTNVLNFSDEEEMDYFDFDRMVIDTNLEDSAEYMTVYFVNYQQGDVVESHVNRSFYEAFADVFIKGRRAYDDYTAIELNEGRKIFIPENGVKMRELTYLVSFGKNSSSEQSYVELFKKALFSDPNGVRPDTIQSGKEYSDGTSKMEVNETTNMIQYVDPQEEGYLVTTRPELIQKSLQFVNEHDGWTDDYRYVDWNQEQQKITYRLFQNGYPVFNDNRMTLMTQKWSNNQIYIYERPYYNITDNIPPPKEQETLPAGQDVFEVVKKHPQFKEENVKNIVQGYELNKVAPNTFAFEPSWHYQYGETWYKVDFDKLGGATIGLE
ncbi:hypothetical protein Q73_00215 [Bacillus coahuilensis m2-6]|uniref:YycH family regulatory protein n=1 Tax=Bacillus coahuilensis TaxID=408580 RepID=UPI00018514E3|nr:two-component system activity regulator YycH [Bacillus coahuilensis]KUP09998.1 hypothetical protein Q73_00215 [Bacillus coahuilensis m2-6]